MSFKQFKYIPREDPCGSTISILGFSFFLFSIKYSVIQLKKASLLHVQSFMQLNLRPPILSGVRAPEMNFHEFVQWHGHDSIIKTFMNFPSFKLYQQATLKEKRKSLIQRRQFLFYLLYRYCIDIGIFLFSAHVFLNDPHHRHSIKDVRHLKSPLS